ncbi:hypothetical protein EON63_09425 [archaeon]|nr:MAG: hypothetical protein EON63_09425 [archaeon]
MQDIIDKKGGVGTFIAESVVGCGGQVCMVLMNVYELWCLIDIVAHSACSPVCGVLCKMHVKVWCMEYGMV